MVNVKKYKHMKKNIKKYVPAYTVDLTEVENYMDVLLAFVDAKMAANLPLTLRDLDAVIENTITVYKSTLFGDYNCVVLHKDGSVEQLCAEPVAERPGYFKRVWNALRGK